MQNKRLNIWRYDLLANAQRSTISGAVFAWVASPGFRLVSLYRIALVLRKGSKLGRLAALFVWHRMVRTTSCYISLQSNIGSGLRLPHPVGIVIGDGAEIGQNVTIYQNVTIGQSIAAASAYPVIGDNTIIYAGATIIGSVKIGQSATIAAHALVTKDVEDGVTVGGIPARPLSNRTVFPLQNVEVRPENFI